jgi:HPt (histidine-containing phosphotransfer) domain-containing protein
VSHLPPDAHFIRRLADDRAEFMRLSVVSREHRGGIEALAHRLAGAAGIFGFVEIGDLAAALESEAQNPSDANGLVLKACAMNLIGALDAVLASDAR